VLDGTSGAMAQLNTLMPNPGNGTNATGDTPQEIVFLVTDGVEDQNVGGPYLSIHNRRMHHDQESRHTYRRSVYDLLSAAGHAWYETYVAPFSLPSATRWKAARHPASITRSTQAATSLLHLSALFQLAVSTPISPNRCRMEHAAEFPIPTDGEAPQKRNKSRNVLVRLMRCSSGVTAIEFAIVGPASSRLLFAILQTALVFFAQQILQTATVQAARLIMTGQAQAAGDSAAQFKTAVCTAATRLFNCGGIYVNGRRFRHSTATTFNPIQAARSQFGMSYSPGGR